MTISLNALKNKDPYEIFMAWLDDAKKSVEGEDAIAMMLATFDQKNEMPDLRTVLLKGVNQHSKIVASSFDIIFYTNKESAKGLQLTKNPRACVNFYWRELYRQIRIRGVVSQLPEEVVKNYFYSRPIESQCSAFLSNQSHCLDMSYEELKHKQEEMIKLHQKNQTAVPFPKNWGGYSLSVLEIEFWAGRKDRLHQRLLFKLEGEGVGEGKEKLNFSSQLLYP